MGKKDKSVEWANWCCLLQRRYIIINHVSITWNISIWKKKENNCRHFLSCAELHIIPCLLSRLWIGQFSPVVLNMIRLLLFGLQSFWIDKAPAHFFVRLFVCLKKKVLPFLWFRKCVDTWLRCLSPQHTISRTKMKRKSESWWCERKKEENQWTWWCS